jgi:hypothetical protein
MGISTQIPDRQPTIIFVDSLLVFPKEAAARLRFALSSMADMSLENSNEYSVDTDEIENTAHRIEWEVWTHLIDILDSQLID